MRSVFFIVLFILNSCQAQETSFKKLTALEEKEYLYFKEEDKVTLITNEEVGKKMFLCLQFIDRKTLKPLKKQKVLFYQTASDGNYYPKVEGDEKTARISGTAFTSDEGKILIETILPGSYSSSGDNRHIHTKVFDAKPSAYDIYFKQYTSEKMKNFIASYDQFLQVNLKKNKKDELAGFLTIKIKK